MLMKQHSYAFYNGHLSGIYTQRKTVALTLSHLASIDSTDNPLLIKISDLPRCSSCERISLQNAGFANIKGCTPSGTGQENDVGELCSAIATNKPVSEHLQFLTRILQQKLEALTSELRGTASDISKAYPANLGFIEHYHWISLPTVVYEIEYPRTDAISWAYVGEKLIAMIGIMFVMIQISQHSICQYSTSHHMALFVLTSYKDPVVAKAMKMNDRSATLSERFAEFPWLWSDLIFPFVIEYLV